MRPFVSNVPFSTDFNFDRLFLSNNSPTKILCFSLKTRSLEVRSHRLNHAKTNTYLAKPRRRYFLFALPPARETGPLQTISQPRARNAGLVPGVEFFSPQSQVLFLGLCLRKLAAVQNTSDIETGNESHFQVVLIHIMDLMHFLWAHDRPDTPCTHLITLCTPSYTPYIHLVCTYIHLVYTQQIKILFKWGLKLLF